jgi:putative SOS response-associated peptidase YedK
MFNARIETIHTKKSFINLICNQQTCILVVEGYYEWITTNLDDDNRSRRRSKEKKKQPYFVCHKDYNNSQLEQCRSSKPLLLAGLWSTVKTGQKRQRHDANNGATAHDDEEEDETITTFTILTTNAHPKYSWLHPRQPIMLWDASIVNEWLYAPNVATVNKLHSVPIHGSIDDEGMKSMWDTGELVVYPVSDKMNTLSYQGTDCNVEIKLGRSSSNKHGIKSYFTSQKQQQQQQQPTGEGPIMKRAKVVVANSTIEEEWACTKCTYVHSGDRMSTYLVCVICGAERGDSKVREKKP